MKYSWLQPTPGKIIYEVFFLRVRKNYFSLWNQYISVYVTLSLNWGNHYVIFHQRLPFVWNNVPTTESAILESSRLRFTWLETHCRMYSYWMQSSVTVNQQPHFKSKINHFCSPYITANKSDLSFKKKNLIAGLKCNICIRILRCLLPKPLKKQINKNIKKGLTDVNLTKYSFLSYSTRLIKTKTFIELRV